MNLTDLRDYVWAHLDLDEDEIPTTLLDMWAREATRKIVRSRKRWPFLQASWTLATVDADATYPLTDLTPSVDEIVSIVAPDRRLIWAGYDSAESHFLPDSENSGTVMWWSVWGDTLTLWPTPTGVTNMILRGYRQVDDWVADGAGAEPDLPEDFHDLIRLHMLASALSQQEDLELASKYANDFTGDLERLKKDFGTGPLTQPMIIGGNYGRRDHAAREYRLRYSWE